MSDKEKHALLTILDSLKVISINLEGIDSPSAFQSNRLVFDAVLMNFIVIGEMAKRLFETAKIKNSPIDWEKIRDFRNFIVHEYLGVDADEVWQIIQNDLPALNKEILKLLEQINKT